MRHVFLKDREEVRALRKKIETYPMKLLKFYFKYFAFRSLGNVNNIESVIRSHGFEIFTFRLEAKEDQTTQLIDALGLTEYARHHVCFLATSKLVNAVFIRHSLSDEDRLQLFFHEEAHVWYNHPNLTSFTDGTETRQEMTANLFLPRLKKIRLLCIFTGFLLVFLSILLTCIF